MTKEQAPPLKTIAEARFNEAPSRSAESSATVVSAVAVVQAGHDRRLERIPSRA